jgi:SAM-dependent methyltransferase
VIVRRPEFIARQAACPSGLLGRIVGRIMAAETTEANRVAVQLLDLRPTDRVLEVGFGHGATIAHLASAVPQGHVAGVDVSEEMLSLASGRNRARITKGMVELRLASAKDLPYPDGCFDKVLCVHTLYFWREPERALAEIRRVLKSTGRLVLAWRHDLEALRSFPEAVYRFHDVDRVCALLRSSGFAEPRRVEHAHRGAKLHFAVASPD